DANRLYDRARVLVNTSDVEGFPNSYLQAWIAGVPVVTLIDPDGVIAREGLGAAVTAPELLGEAVRHLLADPVAWRAASDRCRAYMARHHDEGIVLADYLETFDEVLRGDGLPRAPHASRRAHHA
ncbi:MAG TPA: glycosyltransferase, partial [Vicinamibacterales bacterium]